MLKPSTLTCAAPGSGLGVAHGVKALLEAAASEDDDEEDDSEWESDDDGEGDSERRFLKMVSEKRMPDCTAADKEEPDEEGGEGDSEGHLFLAMD